MIIFMLFIIIWSTFNYNILFLYVNLINILHDDDKLLFKKKKKKTMSSLKSFKLVKWFQNYENIQNNF